jgi:hypothetical protein
VQVALNEGENKLPPFWRNQSGTGADESSDMLPFERIYR